MILHASNLTGTTLRTRLATFILITVCMISLNSCLPKEVIELRDIQNLVIIPQVGADPVLHGDAVFFNPNKSRMKIKAIKVELFVDDKKTAVADHEIDVVVKGNSEFTVPLEVQMQLKDLGLMDTLKSLFGGKTYQLHYVGFLRVNINGLPFKVPIDHREEFKLKL